MAAPAVDDYRVEALCGSHDRGIFSCRAPHLNDYFHKRLDDEVGARLTRAFVLVQPESSEVVGFYTLSSSSIPLYLLPSKEKDEKRMRTYQTVPATLIGRFAIDERAEGRDLGAFLLLDALKRSWQAAESVASWAVVVNTRDQEAKEFWLHHNFTALPMDGQTLFLQMAALDQLFQDA